MPRALRFVDETTNFSSSWIFLAEESQEQAVCPQGSVKVNRSPLLDLLHGASVARQYSRIIGDVVCSTREASSLLSPVFSQIVKKLMILIIYSFSWLEMVLWFLSGHIRDVVAFFRLLTDLRSRAYKIRPWNSRS